MENNQGWVKYQFGLGVFVSAFLLFFIQPLLAKALLPLFGGSGFVWVTCILFFQIGLLFGYLYAYCLTRFFSEKWQAIIHCLLLIFSFYFIPIDLHQLNVWQEGWPPLSVAMGLSLCILIPFMVISASSPLLQHWYCSIQKTTFPYYYYSISNVGSLLGLVGYPFLIEPFLGMKLQSQVWSWLYFAYALLCSICLIQLCVRSKGVLSQNKTSVLSVKTILSWWLVLTLLSSALLVSTTRFFTQNIVNLPLAWVIPLALYLISFIVTFSKPKGYERPLWLMLFVVFSLICAVFVFNMQLNTYGCILSLFVLLYSGCMICHGELIRIKPEAQHLTLFYLYIALGGALGGLYANGISFIPYTKWWDFYLPVIIISGLVIVLVQKDPFFSGKKLRCFTMSFAIIVPCAWLLVSQFDALSIGQSLVYQRRSVYGYMRVYDFAYTQPEDSRRIFLHGTIIHGMEFSAPDKALWPTTYYGAQSGVGLAIEYLHAHVKRPLKIGAIGLGVGTIASSLHSDDALTFYELDPDVKQIANNYFSFLKSSPANIDIILGDGRLQMEKKTAQIDPPRYDLIVIDAFSGDTIPFHLVTKEAMALYQKLLSPEGIIAFHITNSYIDVMPITKALATTFSFDYVRVSSPTNDKKGITNADWMLLTRDPDFFVWLEKQKEVKLNFDKNGKSVLWTDDQNSLVPLFRLILPFFNVYRPKA